MSTEKLSELSKPVAWKFKNADGGDRVSLERKANIYGRHDFQPLYSQEYVSALLAELKFEKQNNAGVAGMVEDYEDKLDAKDTRIAELEARLATPVIGSCDSDPMREHFTCNREGDFYFTTLGSVPGRTYTLYRNEAEALFIGLRDALSAGFTVEGDE